MPINRRPLLQLAMSLVMSKVALEEELLLALIDGHFQDDIETWVNESGVFGARIVPILEGLADVMEREGRECRYLRERALRLR